MIVKGRHNFDPLVKYRLLKETIPTPRQAPRSRWKTVWDY